MVPSHSWLSLMTNSWPATATQMRVRVSQAVHHEVFLCWISFLPQHFSDVSKAKILRRRSQGFNPQGQGLEFEANAKAWTFVAKAIKILPPGAVRPRPGFEDYIISGLGTYSEYAGLH